MYAWSGAVLVWLLVNHLSGPAPWARIARDVVIALVGAVFARRVATGESDVVARGYLVVAQVLLAVSFVIQVARYGSRPYLISLQVICFIFAVRALGVVIRGESTKVADVFE